MTLPVSGPISMSQVNTELLISPSTTVLTMNSAGVRFLTGTTVGTTTSMQQLLGKSYVIAGNSGVLTSGSSYTLPATSGASVKILVIAGGGGGGGGSSRDNGSGGWNMGGGGGGGGGNAYIVATVTPGQAITFSIGGAGSAGSARDGGFSSGADGGPGGISSATVGASVVANASGGGGGVVPPGGSAGAAGAASVGSALVSAPAGQASTSRLYGGDSAVGYVINTTVGTALGSLLTFGAVGAGGVNNSGQAGATGTVYGAGGGGGAANNVNNSAGMNPAGGSAGAVFIWWGY